MPTQLDLADGTQAFVKTRDDAERDEFSSEAASLRWLAEGEVRVPEVLAVGEDPPFLALQFVPEGRLDERGAERFGRGLAKLHALGAEAHGWLPGGGLRQLLGALALDAHPADSWASVYAEQRLLPLTRIASDSGSLGYAAAGAVVAVCDRIEELAGPPEPPARLHGDLWSGNLHADVDGNAWLIDPTAHGGHREMDLAMLRLFSAPFSERIFTAYAEAAPLAEGHAERVPLWQLQPLLVHAALFGGHYGESVERAARRYL